MDNGYVLLHRKLFSNPLWLSERFTKAQAWIDIFANANHKEGRFFVRGVEVKVQRGQLAWSIETMAKRWGWNRKTVMRFLNDLEKGQQIGQQKTRLTTIITIINYDLYQTIGTTKRTTQRTSNGTTDGTQTMNDNNVNKEREAHTLETKDFFSKGNKYTEMLELFSKNNNRDNVIKEFDSFIVYWCESNGIKQRWQLQDVFDVKRRLFTWMSRSNNFNKNKQRVVLS